MTRRSNPFLKKLGFSDDDRVVIIHADDIGMCQATLTAYHDLLEFGLLSSAAVMVPCPWFPQAAAYCRQHPDVDIGVHLTLTSEWDSYRWGPISTRDSRSGLLDGEGYLYRTAAEVQACADPGAVEAEIKAQVQQAAASGLDITHIDTHMGSVMYHKFLPAYLDTARRYHVPALFVRPDERNWITEGMDGETAAFAADAAEELAAEGFPLIDHIAEMSLRDPSDRIEQAKHGFASLQPGLTHYILHPAQDTPELRAIAPDWRCRVADYEAFTSEALRDFIKSQGIQVIGYRALRDALRAP